MANQRLELTWIGKGEDPAIEPRILLHDPSKDYGDPSAENMLIHGTTCWRSRHWNSSMRGR